MSQNVNVNLVPGNYPKEFHVSQYDVGRQLVANIVDSTGAYSIPSGATVTLVGTKPSGFGFTLSGSVGSGGVVTFSTTATVTAEYGRIPCELRITSGSTILGTANCMLIVEESPHPEGTTDGNSETVIPELTLLVERIEAAAESIHDLSVSATTLAAGSDATATYDSTNNSIAFGIPRGADGDVTRSEFNELKSEFDNLVDGEELLFPTPSMAMGTIDASTGEASVSTTGKEWITDYVKADDLVKLIVSSDGNGAVFFYDENQTYQNRVTVNTNTQHTLNHSGYFRFYVHRNNWAVISEEVARSIFSLQSANKIDQRIDTCEKTLGKILYRSVDELKVGLFEKGGLSNGQDDSYGSANRIRTHLLCAINDIVISAKTTANANARLGIETFSEDGTFVSDSGWLTTATISKGTIFRIVCSADITSQATKTVSEVFACFDFNANKGEIKDVFLLDSVQFLFEHGGIENGANNAWFGNARARLINQTANRKDLLIHRKSGAFGIVYYESDGTFIGQTGWLTSDKMIPANQKFRMVVTPNQNDSSYYSLEDILACIEFEEIEKDQFGLNPNIIWQSRNVDDTFYPPYSKWYIQAAAKNQYDRVRFNIRKTTDGHYFLCHDDTINQEARNTDGSAISTSVSANGHTLAELNAYDWGIKYGTQYAGAGVPLLDDALKYSSMYNLGVSVEFSSMDGWTDTDTENCLALFDKYSVSDNLMIIDPYGTYFSFLQKFVEHNPKISVAVSTTESNFNDQSTIDSINALMTGYNNIYVQLSPWGTYPTDTFIEYAKKHNYILTSTIVMSKADLLSENLFGYGYTMIEVNNVYRIKDTIREWVDSLINI